MLAGEKTATAGLAEEEPAPAAATRYVVEDAAGKPRAVVEVAEAKVVPAGEIDLEFARDEGEGFESIEEWREAHERFFERSIADDTLIVAIRFRVVERL